MNLNPLLSILVVMIFFEGCVPRKKSNCLSSFVSAQKSSAVSGQVALLGGRLHYQSMIEKPELVVLGRKGVNDNTADFRRFALTTQAALSPDEQRIYLLAFLPFGDNPLKFAGAGKMRFEIDFDIQANPSLFQQGVTATGEAMPGYLINFRSNDEILDFMEKTKFSAEKKLELLKDPNGSFLDFSTISSVADQSYHASLPAGWCPNINPTDPAMVYKEVCIPFSKTQLQLMYIDKQQLMEDAELLKHPQVNGDKAVVQKRWEQLVRYIKKAGSAVSANDPLGSRTLNDYMASWYRLQEAMLVPDAMEPLRNLVKIQFKCQLSKSGLCASDNGFQELLAEMDKFMTIPVFTNAEAVAVDGSLALRKKPSEVFVGIYRHLSRLGKSYPGVKAGADAMRVFLIEKLKMSAEFLDSEGAYELSMPAADTILAGDPKAFLTAKIGVKTTQGMIDDELATQDFTGKLAFVVMNGYFSALGRALEKIGHDRYYSIVKEIIRQNVNVSINAIWRRKDKKDATKNTIASYAAYIPGKSSQDDEFFNAKDGGDETPLFDAVNAPFYVPAENGFAVDDGRRVASFTVNFNNANAMDDSAFKQGEYCVESKGAALVINGRHPLQVLPYSCRESGGYEVSPLPQAVFAEPEPQIPSTNPGDSPVVEVPDEGETISEQTVSNCK